MNDVTRILSAVEEGDPLAAEQLLPLVYDELRRLAAQKLARERPGQTLDATALVHEAYLRLVGSDGPAAQERCWSSRRHFFLAAAEAMRRILVDRARCKGRLRHGGGRRQIEMPENLFAEEESESEILAVEEALEQFAREDPDSAELVRLHVFAGLTIEETAGILEMSVRTAYRNWQYARAWLYRRLSSSD
jgi:RNA polymerase sigma factor (TIGR02999 family)